MTEQQATALRIIIAHRRQPSACYIDCRGDSAYGTVVAIWDRLEKIEPFVVFIEPDGSPADWQAESWPS
jgi:hypothetical protein